MITEKAREQLSSIGLEAIGYILLVKLNKIIVH
jgi:hypothetical protein